MASTRAQRGISRATALPPELTPGRLSGGGPILQPPSGGARNCLSGPPLAAADGGRSSIGSGSPAVRIVEATASVAPGRSPPTYAAAAAAGGAAQASDPTTRPLQASSSEPPAGAQPTNADDLQALNDSLASSFAPIAAQLAELGTRLTAVELGAQQGGAGDTNVAQTSSSSGGVDADDSRAAYERGLRDALRISVAELGGKGSDGGDDAPEHTANVPAKSYMDFSPSNPHYIAKRFPFLSGSEPREVELRGYAPHDYLCEERRDGRSSIEVRGVAQMARPPRELHASGRHALSAAMLTTFRVPARPA